MGDDNHRNKRTNYFLPVTLLGHELNSLQNVLLNYFVPSLCGCLVYIFNISTDLALVYRHFNEENVIWASLTLFFLYLPVLGCFTFVVSAEELWPEKMQTCGLHTFKWFLFKVLQHLLFPIWAMWRYAERIFWSVEGLRASSKDIRDEALANWRSPRSIEFYFFLQGFLHSIPQVLLQMHIMMRRTKNLLFQTVELQIICVLINIAVLSKTTTIYHRFKTQKLGGKTYPWYKPEKYLLPDVDVDDETKTAKEQTTITYVTREDNAIESTCTHHYQQEESTENDEEPNFLFREIKTLPEDDAIGKMLVFSWWYCFLISRFLAICSFAFFFPLEIVWILSLHFILCVAFLLYDSQAHVVRRTKAAYFILMGLIYIFVIVEVKKEFKKAKFIFRVYFALVFVENFVMCLLWWCSPRHDDDDDGKGWWDQYVFQVVLGFSVLSLVSMVVYDLLVRPTKILVAAR